MTVDKLERKQTPKPTDDKDGVSSNDSGDRSIGILTLSAAQNNGAVLQCHSLCEYLNKHYGRAEIIDFTPRFLRHKRRLIKTQRSSPKEAIRSLRRSFAQLPIAIEKNRRFDAFRKQCSRYSAKKYRDVYKEDNYDLYVVGSDQVFSPRLAESNGQFFLPHILDPARKVTYAASLGVSEMTDEQKRVLSEGLRDFGHISIREQTGQEIVSELFPDRKIYRNIDPVFLTDKSEWLSLAAEKMIPERYILILTFVAFKPAYEIAKKIEETSGGGRKIVTVTDAAKKRRADVENIRAVGPREFLSLIQHADYVITDSFHCTAFSIIFKKKFYSIPFRFTESRVTNMLSDFELDRRITNTSDISIDDEIDFGPAEKRIAEMRDEAAAYFDLFLKR